MTVGPRSWDDSGADRAAPDGAAAGGPQLVLVTDPSWSPTPDAPRPPPELVVGGWWVEPDGSTGRFSPNPAYAPSDPGAPTDPLDATLRLLARGAVDGEELMAVLDSVDLGVALDEDGTALVAPAPNARPSVLVTSSPPHRARVAAPGWREVGLAELAAALPPEGVDVLLNPGGPAAMHLPADTVRRAARAARR